MSYNSNNLKFLRDLNSSFIVESKCMNSNIEDLSSGSGYVPSESSINESSENLINNID